MTAESDQDVIVQRWWTVIIFLIVVVVGIALALFVQRATTQIQEALAEEVLQQQHDVANLLHEYVGVMLALEREQRQANEASRSEVELALDDAQLQLQKMRFQYSFERLDGAATAHAHVKPILEDVEQWLAWGLPGFTARDSVVLEMASQRMADRYGQLRRIAFETDSVATTLISAQSAYLERFRGSLISLLGLFALLALGIAALLIRQRNLQARLRKDQESYAQRIADFADIGADWFWEMTDSLRLKVLSGRALKPRGQDKAADVGEEANAGFNSFGNKMADVHWPTESLDAREEFSEFESDWITDDGDRRVISLSGRPLTGTDGAFMGYRGVARDVTKRRNIELELEAVYQKLIKAQTIGREQAEEALRDSEQFLRISLDSMAANIAILDESGWVKVSNQAWKSYCGVNARYGTGVHYLDAFNARPAAEQSSFQAAARDIDEVLSGHRSSLHLEFSCQLPDQMRWLVIHLTTFESNALQFAVLVYEDITDIRKLEEQDRKLRADLAHVARLTTAGEMATVLAHELNQPLTAISHNSDALLSSLLIECDLSEDVMATVSDIYEQSQRAGGIIQSIRQMVRKDTQSTSSVNINSLVEETVRLTNPEAREHNVNVRLQLADDLPNLRINAVQIQQVLVNLERNGVEAIRHHGSEERDLYITTSQSDDGFIRVTVQDTGPGVTVERSDLFKSFRTTKPDGMGMGLSISQSIVEAHGGRLWLDESPLDMTTFHFTLPVI